MSILRLLDQLCLSFMYSPLFQEVMLILLEVTFLLPKCIFLLLERMFLLTECPMGHHIMDPIMRCSMDRVLHLMGAGIKNLLNLLTTAL